MAFKMDESYRTDLMTKMMSLVMDAGTETLPDGRKMVHIRTNEVLSAMVWTMAGFAMVMPECKTSRGTKDIAEGLAKEFRRHVVALQNSGQQPWGNVIVFDVNANQ